MNCINSYNIFGITGGIGQAFLDELQSTKDEKSIYGFYHKNEKTAKIITNRFPSIKLSKIDLSNLNTAILVPNSEGLLYVAGKSYFSDSLFDFSAKDLFEQTNLNVNALFIIIKKMLSFSPSSLRRVVVVTSRLPQEIKSIYHVTKQFQKELLEILCSYLNERKIGLSIIETGWVNTRMFQDYVALTGNSNQEALEPQVIAEKCFNEFQNTQLFNQITVNIQKST